MSLSSAPVARQSSQWTWALYSHCGVHQRTVTNWDPPATTTACQLHHTTCQRTTNMMPLWQQRKPPSIWSWALNLRDAGKMQERLLFNAALPYFFIVWLLEILVSIVQKNMNIWSILLLWFISKWCYPSLSSVSCLSSVLPCLIPSLLQWATFLSQYDLLSRRTTSSAMSRRPSSLACDTPASKAHPPPATVTGTAHCGAPGAQSWTATCAALAPASSARWTAATPPTVQTSPACWLLLQRPWVEAPCQVRRGGVSLGDQSKLCSPLPGQPDALCQWQGGASPHFESMDFNIDFEIIIIK